MASTPCSGLRSRSVIQHSWEWEQEAIATQRGKVLLSERGKWFTDLLEFQAQKGFELLAEVRSWYYEQQSFM